MCKDTISSTLVKYLLLSIFAEMLHLFNPYNDLALATLPSQRFTPPRQASLIASAGALLPLWWAHEGDFILAPGAYLRWIDTAKRHLGLRGDIYTGQQVDACAPWGWSHDACRRFAEAGVGPSVLPSDGWLNRHRALSHRRISRDMMEGLRKVLPVPLPPTPIEAKTEQELWEAVGLMDGRAMVKLPYSTSGRGIIDTSTHQGLSTLRNGVAGMLRRQGSVMVEKRLDKVADFAMLFDIDRHGSASFMGLSLFDTHGGTAYSGNLLLPDDDILRHLSQWVDMEILDGIGSAYPPLLSRLIGSDHAGSLGVDMLIYRDTDGSMRVNPCVEVNLRMTMGVVAHHLTQIFYDGTPLRFTIAPGGVIPEKNIIRHLVPPNPDFTFAITENLK